MALELCLSAAASVRAVGIDHSALMIAKAAKRNRAAVTSGRLKLYEGSVDALPASTPAFDKAFSNNVIQFVDDQQGFLIISRRI